MAMLLDITNIPSTTTLPQISTPVFWPEKMGKSSVKSEDLLRLLLSIFITNHYFFMKHRFIYSAILFIFFSSLIVIACNNTKQEEIKDKIGPKNAQAAREEYTLSTNYNFFDATVDAFFTNTYAPTETQLKNYSLFLIHQDSIANVVLDSIFQFYKKVYPDYAKSWNIKPGKLTKEELEENIPTPTTPQALKKHIRLMTIHFPDSTHSESGTFGIAFECTWDIEHGIGAFIKNWKVKEVGLAETGYFVND